MPATEVSVTASYNLPPLKAFTFDGSNVTASGFVPDKNPEFTVDDDMETRWSQDENGAWIQYEFDVLTSIYGIDIAWFKADTRKYNFRVLGSINGSEWNELFSGESVLAESESEMTHYMLESDNVNFLRIEVNGNSDGNNFASFYEINFYGEVPPLYPLTVNGGSGSGDYAEGQIVEVSADDPVEGQIFDNWSGDTGYLDDANAENTNVTMPAQSIEITANYRDVVVSTLTVTGGSGSGDYEEGQVVEVSADNPAAGQIFDYWSGDTEFLDDANAETTNLNMPAQAVAITANYRDLIESTLTVNNGSGSGVYTEGVVVDITADVAPSGQRFVQWTGDVASVEDVNSTTTTLTMPTSDVTVTATYEPIPDQELLTGEQFDNIDPWSGNPELDGQAAFDGNTGTFVDAGAGSGAYTGIELEKSASLTMIRYYPRGNYPSRMEGGIFQGSNDGVSYIDIHTISTTPTVEWNEVEITTSEFYKYYRYLSAPDGYCNVAEIEFLGVYANRLTVIDGSGSGEYNTDEVVNIAATVTPGKEFSEWTGDVGYVADASSAETTVTMPANDITLTATFSFIDYTLTVNEGTGGGTYNVGDEVNISANAPSAGMEFDVWSGDIDNLDDPSSPNALLTMPAAEVEVTATYRAIRYDLTVTNGVGDGQYPQGEEILVMADGPGYGQEFDQWTSSYADLSSIMDVNAPNTTLTMPAQAIEIEATYTDLPRYTLTVENGTGGGEYFEGQEVTIEADTPADGKIFDKWTGATDNVDDANASTATVTMPGEAITLTATYADIPTYTLTVENGSGSGDYEEGVIVDITADVPEGSTFDGWTGDTDYVDDVNAAATTITMPASNITVTANIVTGVARLNANEINVFPNPVSNGVLRITSDGMIDQIVVIDIIGSKVMQEQNVASVETSLNVGSLSNGQYLIKIIGQDGNVSVRKFIKR